MKAQISLCDEKILDSFAGGGGASTGIELAIGRIVDYAINHDPAAILMHKTNHPFTAHYQASVWDVLPEEILHGSKLGLAWFSPDCKHFSKAKGDKPVDKNIRGLAWVVLRWALLAPPRVIMLENVEEFQTWGPLICVGKDKDGKEVWRPDPEHRGETFKAFVGMLSTGITPDHPALLEACEFLQIDPKSKEAAQLVEGLGYDVDYRELVAANYGAATTRRRFFMIARCDGKPIVWPEPTHAPRDSEDVISGKKLPWKSASEIIDWSLPCPSIFETRQEIKEKYGLVAQRPLRPNTMRRVARGVDKYTIKNGTPFIVPTGYGERPGQAPRIHDIGAPVPTAVGTAKHGVCSPYMVQVNHAGDFRGQAVDDPVQTITAKLGAGVASPVLSPFMAAIGQTGGGDRIRSMDAPIHTQVSKAEECLVCPSMIQYHTEQSERVRGHGIEAPIMTIDAANRYGLTAAHLTKYYSGDHAQDVAVPLHTVTTMEREGVVETAFMQVHHAGGYNGKGQPPTAPVNTITAKGAISVQTTQMVKLKGGDIGGPVSDPVPTITAGGNHHGIVVTKVVKAAPGVDLGHWPKIRDLLNEYCGYDLADDEVILFLICGEWWVMVDIGLRMLTPKELYRASGFPDDYIIDRDYLGNEYKRDKQVARCGNAVPPPFATALVRANFPEWCGEKPLTTMAELEEAVAV